MLKKVFKSFFLLSLVTVIMLTGTTAAYAESNLVKTSDDESIEGYMYYPDDLFVKAGSKVVLKSLKTTNGTFFQKGMNLGSFIVVLNTEKTSPASFSLNFDVTSTKNETSHTIKNYSKETSGYSLVPNFYNDSFVKITLVAKDDLYISSYSFYK